MLSGRVTSTLLLKLSWTCSSVKLAAQLPEITFRKNEVFSSRHLLFELCKSFNFCLILFQFRKSPINHISSLVQVTLVIWWSLFSSPQPLSPSSQRRLQQLTGKHGSGKIYQVTSSVVGSRDLDLNLTKGELVAIISGADTRGDKRRWLVDAGGGGWFYSDLCPKNRTVLIH